ncbi:hypothetical protein CTheo_7739 [Ceratobasidium theobromae]|uniref:Transmembrane protein n=1 Tax=Ceratobasidium theobromae TaxID=1582974 RepID=A0A5N5QBR1_9AGAM|nr:hypothetical protein CTheo_7739 [Ceratobasidium theobromae]
MAAVAELTHEQALDEIKKIKDLMTPELQVKANVAMLNKAATPDTTEKLLEAVKELSDGAKKVYQAFNEVFIGLEEVDKNNYTDEHGKPLEKLHLKWDDYRNRFIKLVWESRKCASETAAYTRDFFQNYLPALESIIKRAEDHPESWESSVAQAKAALKSFSEKPNPSQARSPRPVPPGSDPFTIAQIHSQDFLTLKDEISAFASTFGSFAKFKEGELGREIKILSGKIDALTVEVEMYSEIIKYLGIAIGGTVAGTAAIAAGLVAGLGPLGIKLAAAVLIVGTLVVIGEVTALIVHLEKKADVSKELEEKKAEKKRLESDLKELQRLQSKLKDQQTNIDIIINNLDKFANIWATVAASATEVRLLLENAASPDPTMLEILKNQIATLKSCYSNIYQALSLYATNVADSGIPNPGQ